MNNAWRRQHGVSAPTPSYKITLSCALLRNLNAVVLDPNNDTVTKNKNLLFTLCFFFFRVLNDLETALLGESDCY